MEIPNNKKLKNTPIPQYTLFFYFNKACYTPLGMAKIIEIITDDNKLKS